MTMNGVLAVILCFFLPNPVALGQLRQNGEDYTHAVCNKNMDQKSNFINISFVAILVQVTENEFINERHPLPESNTILATVP